MATKEYGQEEENPVHNDPSILANIPANADNFPSFIVPPMNAELKAEYSEAMQKEAALRKLVAEDTIKFNAAEEERERAWRVLCELRGGNEAATSGDRAIGINDKMVKASLNAESSQSASNFSQTAADWDGEQFDLDKDWRGKVKESQRQEMRNKV